MNEEVFKKLNERANEMIAFAIHLLELQENIEITYEIREEK